MKYYLYFDGYGNFVKAITEEELKRLYSGDPDRFLNDMSGSETGRSRFQTGHVATFFFKDKKELEEFIGSLGDEVEGFYCCRSDSRPYNF